MEQIGRYKVERLLAKGGMAEVFLAQAQGPHGFAKRVVLKRILPELSDNPQLVQMFLDEARLAALLNHPNIVQTYDFGEADGRYYLAMEYIEGISIREAIRYCKKMQREFPPHLAVQMIIGVCEGLAYAHRLCDENGASYNIVHRDISPDNILISSSGIPKVVDFGIAKAASSDQRTQAGVIKGKYAYMSPEQIRGKGINRQLDVYALGVTLYEMLTGDRPFVADNELTLLNMILEGVGVPLASEKNPKVPVELAQIVARAMATDVAHRYPDTAALQQALDAHLSSTGRRVANADLAVLVDEIRAHKRSLGDRMPSGARLLSETKPALPPTPPPDAAPRSAVSSAAGSPRPVDTDAPQPTLVGAPDHATQFEAPPTAKRKTRWWIPAAAVVAAGAVAAVLMTQGDPPAAPVAAAPVVSPPPPVTNAPAPVTPAPEPTETAAVPPPLPSEGTALDAGVPVLAEAPTRAPTSTKRPTTKRPPTSASKPAVTGHGYLTLRSNPWSDVELDGKQLGVTPLVRVKVPAGRHTLILRNDEEKLVRRIQIVVAPDQELKQAVKLRE